MFPGSAFTAVEVEGYGWVKRDGREGELKGTGEHLDRESVR